MKETIIVALKLHIKNKIEMSVQNQKTILKYINKQDKEIERLNNIIKELTQENLKRSDKIDELLEIKNKAIEFIEEELTFYITIGGTNERKLIGYNKAFDELLKILKGDSSN